MICFENHLVLALTEDLNEEKDNMLIGAFEDEGYAGLLHVG
jgi:hypothetical protein